MTAKSGGRNKQCNKLTTVDEVKATQKRQFRGVRFKLVNDTTH